jgi:hypothetical protein
VARSLCPTMLRPDESMPSCRGDRGSPYSGPQSSGIPRDCEKGTGKNGVKLRAASSSRHPKTAQLCGFFSHLTRRKSLT